MSEAPFLTASGVAETSGAAELVRTRYVAGREKYKTNWTLRAVPIIMDGYLVAWTGESFLYVMGGSVYRSTDCFATYSTYSLPENMMIVQSKHKTVVTR